MPRAIGCFWRVDVTIEPWPAYDSYADLINNSRVAEHERLGLLAYWVQGATTA